MNWKSAARYVGIFLIGYGLTEIVREIARDRKAVAAESAEKPVLTYGTAFSNAAPHNFGQEIHEVMSSLANTSLYTGITWGWKMHAQGWTLQETLLEYTNRWYRTNQ